MKETGLVQLKSLLPINYPGHNILTEDIGIIYGIDNCKCKRKGKIFKILGRLSKSEIRGAAMQFNLNKIKINIEQPYNKIALDFIDEFSSLLRKHKNFKKYPDLHFLSLWSSKKEILKKKELL